MPGHNGCDSGVDPGAAGFVRFGQLGAALIFLDHRVGNVLSELTITVV